MTHFQFSISDNAICIGSAGQDGEMNTSNDHFKIVQTERITQPKRAVNKVYQL